MAGWILLKLGMDIMPLEAAPNLYFLGVLHTVVWVKNTSLACPCLSVCHIEVPLLEPIVLQLMWWMLKSYGWEDDLSHHANTRDCQGQLMMSLLVMLCVTDHSNYSLSVIAWTIWCHIHLKTDDISTIATIFTNRSYKLFMLQSYLK